MKPCHKNRGVKMMLCVRMDLKMDKGKMAAQCCHATLGLYKKIVGKSKMAKMVEDWENNGQKKIVAKLKSEAEMNLLVSNATDAGIPFYVVVDAGKTQVAAGSRTIIALMEYENKMDTVTGRLKLM